MQLKKLNLSGFKSFVDATSITIPADFTGIVGPNGCGKSNVIDAVRWVMGEASARNLRGESMSDVIFNGSGSRKPVGKASVELLFDNSEGTAPDAYAAFAEISVRRTLSRDGTSEYLINRARCRRRDITDLFRGTGLGARSYSIIEQGMVSRIVEARPEELRSFVEEAAGITRYKDRRRETETRIRHTRENLDRIEDIRSELASQLRRLQRQSQAARRYQKLRDEEWVVNGQLLAVRYVVMKQRSEEQDRSTAQARNQVEAELAQQRSLESKVEEMRTQQSDAQKLVNDIQAGFYTVGAEVASVEQRIEHTRETEQQQRSELGRLTADLESISTQLEQDSLEHQKLEDLMSRSEALRASRESALQSAQQQLQNTEQLFEDWQERWHDFTQQAAEPARNQEVQRTRIEQFESVDQKTQERLARLDEEDLKLLEEEEQLDVEGTRTVSQQHDQQVEDRRADFQKLAQSIEDGRRAAESLAQRVDEGRKSMHATNSRLESLIDLQESALKHDDRYQEWLIRRGLSHAPRLAEEVKVADGWEAAADALLGNRLAGLGVGSIENTIADETALPASNLFFIESGPIFKIDDDSKTLSSKVRSSRYDLQSVLAGAYIAETLPEAMQRRTTLKPHECVVTRCGTVVGKNWVRAPRRPDNETGLLSREDEIDGLRAEVSRLVPATQALEDELLTVRERFRFLEQQQQTEQQEVHGLRLTRDEHRQSLADKEARFAQIETRRHQLASEMEELISELGKTGEGLDDARRNLALAENETGSVDSDREALLKEKQQVSDVLIQARRAVQDNRDQLHRAELDLQGVRASLESIQAGRVRLTTQHQQTAFRHQELEHTLRVGVEPEQVLRQRLDELLDSRIEVETRLTAARNDCAQFDEALRDTQALVSECEQRVAVARDALQEHQLKAQELDVRMDTLREQIEASKYVLERLLAELPDDAEEFLWAEKSQQLGEKIAKIGPVNLVAIEEFEEQSERKSYLDKQHADLVEALDTLESAIKKIDRETRDRFKQTFDNLNAGFIEFFPRLFGGGNAILELTDGDYLTAGVTVMARPPGKRNSTIHLLSGGEKALAAVALLFALFRLNPAPFCILDEVDAPLDDANVVRYCQTLRTLSERSQLIVITHNKITMESSDVLLGVTMGEPGVSSIVSVDIEEAVEIAAQ